MKKLIFQRSGYSWMFAVKTCLTPFELLWPNTVDWLAGTEPHFLLIVLEAGSQDQALVGYVLVRSCFLAVLALSGQSSYPSHVGEGAGAVWGVFYRGTHLIMGLHPHGLIFPQRPHFLIHEMLKIFLKMHLKYFFHLQKSWVVYLCRMWIELCVPDFHSKKA